MQNFGFAQLLFITASIVAELRTRINSGAIKNPMQGSLCIGGNVRRIYSAFGSVFGSAFLRPRLALGASLASSFTSATSATASTFGSAFLRPRLALGFSSA